MISTELRKKIVNFIFRKSVKYSIFTRPKRFCYKILLMKLLPLSILLLFFSCTTMSPDERAIRNNFARVQNAVGKNMEKTFVRLTDDETKRYFKRIKETAITADKPTLQYFFTQTNTPVVDKLYIFSIRSLFKNIKLSTLTEEEFIALLLSHGLFSDLAFVEIQSVELKSPTLSIAHILTSINTRTKLSGTMIFVKSEEEWKVDLTSRLPLREGLIKIFCKKEVNIDYQSVDCFNEYTKKYGGFELDTTAIWLPMEI